jgi:hypothetical protein
VFTPRGARRVATLWTLAWHGEQVSCVVYRTTAGLELAVQSGDRPILSEHFDLQPRALARAAALRASLKRRGWMEPAEEV